MSFLLSSGVRSAIRDSVVDDFEDNDIDEYSGDTWAFSTQSDTVKKGSYALEYTSTSRNAISSTLGLDNYPSIGDKFDVWIRASGAVSNQNLTHFAVPSETGVSSISGYALNFNPNGDKIEILRYDNGSSTSLGSTSVSLSFDTWYKQRLGWGNDDTLQYKLIDESETVLASVSATDSNYATDSGIGFQANTGGGSLYWDEWLIT